MSIPDEYLINDVRSLVSFKKSSFSNYKLSEVNTIFKQMIMKEKIEESCYWTAELFCSGYVEKVYEFFLILFCKNINIYNPELIYRLYKRYNSYLELSKANSYKELINNQSIRNQLCELSVLFCKSIKNKTWKLPSITNEDLTLKILTTKLVCKDYSLIQKYIKNGDTDELKICMSELCHSIHIKQFKTCCYWVCWINYFEKLYLKKNKEYICGYRDISTIEEKYKKDYVWFIWEIIIDNCDDKSSIYIQSLLQFYKYKFTKVKKNKRFPIIIACLKMLTEPLSTIKLENDNNLILICSRINMIYKEIKKNEVLLLENNYENNEHIINNKSSKQFALINEIDKLIN
tara:strand:- start:19106 stop:20143 length:1038 start_codon:yes stop_codon:yes gene_type:complete